MKFLSIKQNNKGFTLLEILVVISIIGILIAIGASAFSTAQKKSRDARRTGDMKAIQNAFEQYYAAHDSSYGTCADMSSELVSGIMLKDPKPSAVYNCTVDASSTKYCVCATLDNPGTGNANSTGSDGTCSYSSTNNNYFCVSSLQ